MTIFEIAVLILLVANLSLMFFIMRIKSLAKSTTPTDPGEQVLLEKSELETKYFEYVEDYQGALKNSKRLVIKAQVFLHGMPVGHQFIMSEHIIEEFSYDKVRELRKEIVEPLVVAGVKTASLIADTKTAGAGFNAKAVTRTKKRIA